MFIGVSGHEFGVYIIFKMKRTAWLITQQYPFIHGTNISLYIYIYICIVRYVRNPF